MLRLHRSTLTVIVASTEVYCLPRKKAPLVSYYPEFARLVEKALARLDRSPSWLAQRVGVSRSTVSRWLNYGTRPRDPETVVRVADVLGQSSQRQALLLAAGFGYAEVADRQYRDTDPFADRAQRPASDNLPLQPTPFLGRERELSDLQLSLQSPDCRLLTLVGPGGIGKTRLALEAADRAGGIFTDGATFVSLAPLSASEVISPTVAVALGVTLPGRAAPETELLHYLRRKELLLVLDNFEHLLAPLTPSTDGKPSGGATELLTKIIQQAPGVKILVTSRERLKIQGEWVFDVSGLATSSEPDKDGEETAGASEASSAVALFLQTARRVRTDFSPTAAELSDIVRICQLVHGVPLALELAAAWIRVLSCREIANDIQQSLNILTTTLRDTPDRHRSMQAVFDHSWSLLSEEEQHVFACCAVFRGGFTRGAAADVAGASLPILAALVDKSLLRRDPNERYEVHELSRQYGAAQLTDSRQEEQIRNRHLLYFARFAEAAEQQIRRGNQLQRVELEHDNLRAALEWSLSGGEFEPGLCIVGALWEFWMNRGHAPEGQALAERFLARPEASALPYLRAKALHTAGVCAFYHGRYLPARTWLAECIDSARSLGPHGRLVLADALIAQSYTMSNLGDLDTMQTLGQETLVLGQELCDDYVKGHALSHLAYLDWQRGDYEGARRRFLESLKCFQNAGHNTMYGSALWRLSKMYHEQGDFAAANGCLRKSLRIHENLGDRVRTARTFSLLGHVAMAEGNGEEARALWSKALALLRATAHLQHQIDQLDALGRLAQQQGDYGRARALHRESLALCIELDHPVHTAHVLEACACLATRQGQAQTAAQLFGATEASHASPPSPLRATWSLDRDQIAASARTQLGERTFASAWSEGAALSLHEAVALAQAVVNIAEQ